MKKICFVNGSPRIKNSCSQYYINLMKEMLDLESEDIQEVSATKCLKSNTETEAFKKMADAEKIIFSFPLYIDSIPSHLLEFLHQFENYYKENKGEKESNSVRVYAIINNGFPEGAQNKNAARIMHHFADDLGFSWRLALGIGAGEFMRETKDNMDIKSKMKVCVYEALLEMKNDIESTEQQYSKDIFTNPKMPKSIFMFMANRHWVNAASRNNVSKKELYNRPSEIRKTVKD